MLISNAVNLLGYEFLEASDGVMALEVLENNYQDISLMLVDWNMPNMSGIDLIRFVKNDERFKHIPIMMVTTETEKERIIEAVKAGVKNYVTKPFSAQDLAIKIIETLGLS